jgi:hypothetical protein
MADFSLTTLFVVPVGQVTLPSAGSTQNLTAGQVGVFTNTYALATAGTIAAAPYFYIAQGRTNTYLQGSKRSDKIAGSLNVGGKANVTEWYKVAGCATPSNQVTDIKNFHVGCGEEVTITLRAQSSYIDTLYYNGYTKSVTVTAPCCACDGGDPCVDVDVPKLIDAFIAKFAQRAPGINSDNVTFSNFYQFQRIGNDADAILRISGKPLTKYGNPCDVAAFPYEYDRMTFRTFVYSGPATTADFIVADTCNIVADANITQRASYATGSSDEIAQLEKNYYSYQAGYLKHLYRMAGYNQNFDSFVAAGSTYDTYYIRFNEIDKAAYNWGDYIPEDSTVIIAAVSGGAFATALQAVLVAALGAVASDNACVITTSTTTTVWPTTSTTTTLIP